MKEIGQFFKERLDQATPDVPDQLWNKIHQNPELKRFNRISRFKKGMLNYATPFIAVTAIAIIVWQLTAPKSTESSSLIPAQNKMEKISVPKQVTLAENSTSKKINTPIPVQRTNKNTNSNNSSLPGESIKTHNTSPNNSTTISNSNVSITKQTPSEISNNPISTPATINKSESSQVMDLKPKNTSTTTVDQPSQTTTSNSTTIPDTEQQLFIPKGFTPNNDGTNDQFLVIADGEVENFEMMIFNRGGGLVFKSSDIHQGWDGTSNNTEVSQGVYVYKIMYKNQKGDSKIVKGTLTLIR